MTRRKKAPIPDSIRKKVFRRDGHRCRYCGNTSGPFHLDHVYPESKGGETTVSNLVVSCADCNHKKSHHVGKWPNPIDYDKDDRIVIAEAKVSDLSSRITRSSPFVFAVSILVGTLLVVSLDFFGIGGEARSSAHLIGAIFLVFGIAGGLAWDAKK